MASNRWVSGKPARQSALHRALGMKGDAKITGKDLGNAMKSKSSRARRDDMAKPSKPTKK